MTQKEIAKILGVSRSTVSLALNNYPKINKETRERILKVAKLLNYRPNVIAQNLVRGKTFTIGLMQPFPFSPFFVELTGRIHQLLRKRNYVCVSIDVGSEREFDETMEIFISRKVDGLICLISFLGAEDILRIKNENLRVVFYHENPEYPADIVAVNAYKAGSITVEHLIGLGHKKIGYIGKGIDESTDRRYTGFKDTIIRHNLPFNNKWIISGYGSFQTGFQGMGKLLSLKERPTAIIAHNDVVAIGAVSAVYQAGLKVPQDIAIVGFDNIENSKYLNVPLTTVEFPIEKIAKKLVEILFQKIENNKDNEKYRKFVFEPRLIIRKSCGYHLAKGSA